MRNYDLSPLLRQWIGFDKLANAPCKPIEHQSFPPYNMVRDDNHYRITLRWRFPPGGSGDPAGRHPSGGERHAGKTGDRDSVAASGAG